MRRRSAIRGPLFRSRGHVADPCRSGAGHDVHERNAKQGAPDLPGDHVEQPPFVHEPDLDFSGMNVRVHLLGRKAECEHRGRVPVVGDECMVGFRKRACEEGAADGPPVDEEPLVRPPQLGGLGGAEDPFEVHGGPR